MSYNVGSTGVPATPTVSFTYGTNATQNNNGRLLTMTDGVGSETYTYDALGRLTQVHKVISGTTYISGYAYNLAGELTAITYPSGRVVQQSYDVIGRLTTIASGGTNYASTFVYNPAGQVTRFNYGNGVTATLTYSPERLALAALRYSKGATDLLNLTYGYTQTGGNDGQITGITDNVDNGRTVNYTYDALHRLKTALTQGSVNYPQWGLSWTYDRYGNRTAQTVTAGTAPANSLTVDPVTNRITGTGYTYDANGNMTADGLNSLAYDAENRVVTSSGSTYTYDGNGLRLKKEAGGNTTVYIFSGTKVIAEYVNGAAPTSPTREYIYSGSQLLATIEGGATKYHHADHLSVRLTTKGTWDPNGNNVLNERGHYPFGELWYETGTAEKPKFTSYERDGESLNDYAMNRYYVNRFGRFSSPDPIAGSLANPQSLNRYTYVLNDPVNLTDPLGLVYDEDREPAGFRYLAGFFGSLCTLDGADVPCSFALRLVASGSAAVLPPGISTMGFFNGVPYMAVFDDEGLHLDALAGGAFYYKNGDPVRTLDLDDQGNPQLPLGTPEKYWSPFEQGFNAAMKALTKKRCSAFFGGQGAATMSATEYRFVPLSSPNVGAATISATSVFINSNGPYMKYSPTPGKAGPFGIFWTQPQFRAFILLHELGHQLSSITGFKPDARSLSLDEAQSRRVIGACF